MKIPRPLFVSLALVGLALALAAAPVEASPGRECSHTPECSAGEVCVADTLTGSSGHCVRIRVLP